MDKVVFPKHLAVIVFDIRLRCVQAGHRQTETPAMVAGALLSLYFQCSEFNRAKWQIFLKSSCRCFKLKHELLVVDWIALFPVGTTVGPATQVTSATPTSHY